ncbi:MAG: hypothetical protein OXU36_07580 [Candidatus Poribacteria bacterium]|nr:hypothetical protein [Candidatus Poribacteria bacterium]
MKVIVLSVALSPDGNTLASAGMNSPICLWAHKRLIRTLKGHTEGVESVSFSPEGDMLASGGSDGTVLLWKLK